MHSGLTKPTCSLRVMNQEIQCSISSLLPRGHAHITTSAIYFTRGSVLMPVHQTAPALLLGSCLRKRDSSGVHGCVVTVPRDDTRAALQAVFDVYGDVENM